MIDTHCDFCFCAGRYKVLQVNQVTFSGREKRHVRKEVDDKIEWEDFFPLFRIVLFLCEGK